MGDATLTPSSGRYVLAFWIAVIYLYLSARKILETRRTATETGEAWRPGDFHG